MKTGIYEHYKGNRYEVIDTLRHSETEELMVLYRAMYGDETLWARPYTMFFEEVEVNNTLVPRFRYIGSENV
ncbi:DUF1653 domain-containing protein [Candidatus Sulfurimonas baltica]|uniref:DUF1653 domain-containing protein n=1 Tax=Candidatus Sulfurimonas baltica TaxID=2740404 RepID=A0A7S7RNJ0_9BACT|nr:DUF1653 domain-containing protein [Candidatus Sulfurimonas baltica]QOY52601.1 DUF1653 domain-containing protein [Candidatus Sulfurimonas baltica]